LVIDRDALIGRLTIGAWLSGLQRRIRPSAKRNMTNLSGEPQ